MFLRTSQVLTLVALLSSQALNLHPSAGERPKVLVGPVSLAQCQSCSFTLESEGNVSANTTYSVATDKPSWFTGFPSSVVIPAGEHSVTFNASYVGGQTGSASITAWNADGSVNTIIPTSDRTLNL